MILTGRINEYCISEPLSSNLIKVSKEYFALALLRYCIPNQFDCLKKAESPDLQDDNGLIGIEVTDATSEQEQQISGESIKYSKAKFEEERQKSLSIIRRNGGDRNEWFISYPVSNEEREKKNVKRAYLRKLKKVECYRKVCTRLGLFIEIDTQPLFAAKDLDWEKCSLSSTGKGFDFVILSSWKGLELYDFEIKENRSITIKREDRDTLKFLARLTAEGIINENDPEWQMLSG